MRVIDTTEVSPPCFVDHLPRNDNVPADRGIYGLLKSNNLRHARQ